jgi:protocatechuate 3,4-dioxygenase beta subunit
MNRTLPGPKFELVVLASNQQDDLELSVRRLHRYLTERFDERWQLTIAVAAACDGTLATACHLVDELEHAEAVPLPIHPDRKALRAQWSTSPADTVAFVQLAPDSDLDLLLAPLTGRIPDVGRLLSRRSALAVVGGAGLTALLAACGSSKNVSSATTATPTTTAKATNTTAPASSATTPATSAAAATPTSVVLAPEMTEGPYYLDLDLVRSDVTEDREGAPLALNFSVVDLSTGAAINGAAIDIWHCDANGLYSGFVSASASANSGGSTSDDGTFLRGTQLTDASGKAAFATIYPGWYQGRTVHIHIKVHVSGKVIHVGQLFFDDTFTDAVYAATAPYSSRSARGTRNADDGIYRGGGDQSTLVVAKSGSGYAATMTMGVKG